MYFFGFPQELLTQGLILAQWNVLIYSYSSIIMLLHYRFYAHDFRCCSQLLKLTSA